VITSIKTVALYVGDQQKAHDFYVDQLGFEVRTDADMGEMGRWLEVAPRGAQTVLVLADGARFGKLDQVGHSADLTFTTPDVAELYQQLVAKGVPVTEPQAQDWGTFLQITDPDGHEFVVSEQR
jgi:uncharacterized glyoxalase superfamily protein PhnB